ncbi:MAG: hypothetical protein ACE5GU_04235 [Candidatus Scalinduaceae bacterium]
MKGKINFLFLIVIIPLASCASTKIPTVYERAEARDASNIQVTDADILALSSDVVQLFQSRMRKGWLTRKISETIRLVTASAAGGFGISSHDETEIITALSLTSAIVPPLQNVWQAGETAMAFQQGVSMIVNAEARYYTGIAVKNQSVNNDGLSKEGAELFKEVTNTITVVTKTLAGQIPTITELEAAEGIHPSATLENGGNGNGGNGNGGN